MRHSIVWIFVGALLTLLGCGESSHLPDVSPPTAKVEPTELEKHGHVRVDNYFWLNKREDPEVVAYLEAENRYTKAIMAGSEDLQGELFDEIKGRIKKDDSSVPYELDGYYYYTRYEQKDEYPIYARKKGSLDSDEQIIVEAQRIHRQTVVTRAMPVGNLTNITDTERALIDRWYQAVSASNLK